MGLIKVIGQQNGFPTQPTKAFGRLKRLQTQNMRMTMQSTNSMTLASLGLIFGRSRVAPSLTMLSSLMTKLKLMLLQKKWKDLSEVEKSKKKEEDDAKDDKDTDDDDDDEEKKEEA